ncbi:zinc finger and BTB domain-containing protein 24-like isoform X2 [Mya arenaria]|nr:zinc finger and BTB domain-containing protein 24-like isoform X2 [Mya arenaria]XP_052773598.1 zinc finger and BTB domain-containing protein 24-like isoform X2 [Mya arenaria]
MVEGELTESAQHVIYYIEDGSGDISRSDGKVLVDSSVQANDYEIERRSGRLPARKRLIPAKFRDYKNASDPDSSDTDFDPHEYTARVKRPSLRRAPTTKQTDPFKTGSGKKTTSKSTMVQSTADTEEYSYDHSETSHTLDTLIEEKYQLALKLAREKAQLKNIPQSKSVDGMRLETDDSFDGERGQNVTDDGMEGQPEGETASQPDKEVSSQDSTPAQQSVYVKEEIRDMAEATMIRRGRGRPRGQDWGTDFPCPDCGKVFKVKGNLRIHLKTHLDLKLFSCSQEGCEKTYSTNEGLKRHLLTHQGIKPFQCDVCQQYFSSSVALTEHRTLHFDEKMHQCPSCERRFRHVSSFRRHLTTHTSAMPYICTVCNRQFAQPSYLRSHMRTHTGEKPFKCPICGKMFAHQSDVKRHRTTHTGEKPYQCSKCIARFSDVSSKNRHEKEHENNKRFTCNLCNDTFKRTGQLRSHINNKHHAIVGGGVPIKVDRNPTTGETVLRLENGSDIAREIYSGDQQQRIVSLIKSLQTKTGSNTQTFVDGDNIFEITQPGNQSASGQVTDISQLGKEEDSTNLEGDVPIELQGVEIPAGENGPTYIAIMNDTDSDSNKLTLVPNMNYHVIYETDEAGGERQLLVPFMEDGTPVGTENLELEYDPTAIPVNETAEASRAIAMEPVPETDEEVTHPVVENDGNMINHEERMECDTVVTAEDTTKQSDNVQGLVDSYKDNTVHSVAMTELENSFINADSHPEMCVDDTSSQPEEAGDVKSNNQADLTEGPGLEFINNPDFANQEYYDWLTNFTEWCKLVSMPLDTSLFQKISQVHKTVSDVMASPSGVVAEKQNFIVLMTITKELSSIVNEHLLCVMQSLDEKADTV